MFRVGRFHPNETLVNADADAAPRPPPPRTR